MINKNPLAQYTTATEKHNLYTQSCATNTVAYKSDESRIPLRDVPEHNVEFIGGLWRVQDDFKYKITKIRDRKMILGQRIQHAEKTFLNITKQRCWHTIVTVHWRHVLTWLLLNTKPTVAHIGHMVTQLPKRGHLWAYACMMNTKI